MPKSILLADDSLTIQKVIELTFSDTDYELTTVSNGVEALSTLSRSRPDLVMADVVMPGKNGYEVCEAIKSDPALAGIPVILLSGTFEPFDRERAERAGANAIVTKPFDSKSLLVQVEALLHAPARLSPTTVGVPAAPSPTPPAAETRAIPFVPDRASDMPSEITSPEFAEFPAENAFDEAMHMAEPPTPLPLDAERAHPAPAAESAAFPLDDTSPFGHVPPDDAPGERRETEVGAAPFSDADNVFEFPSIETSSEGKRESGAPALPERWAAPRADQEITQELSVRGISSLEEFHREPAFLHHEPDIGGEQEPGMPEAVAVEPEAGPTPPREMASHEIASDIERLAQGASISDLASMVSRLAGPVSLSDEDVDRISRRVVEHLSEKIVRDIAWEIIPDIAEILVRQRLRELEAETSGESQ